MESFGRRLNQLRKEKELSQEEFAEIMNVSRQSISKWENDNAYPEMTKLIFMSNFFGVTLDYLILGEESVQTVMEENPSIGKVENLLKLLNSFFSNMQTKQKLILALFCAAAVMILIALLYGAGFALGQLLYYISR